MSFMFKPFPYDDMSAVNRVNIQLSEQIIEGNEPVKQKLKEFVSSKKNIAIDGYPSCDFKQIVDMLDDVVLVDVATLYKSSDVLYEELKYYLPEDRIMDPVLLYGKLYHNSFSSLMEPAKIATLIERLKGDEKLVVYGHGALIAELLPYLDGRIYLDITPKEAAIRCLKGEYINVGDKVKRPFKELMRRNYYVDFDVELNMRKSLLQNKEINYYLCGDHKDNLQMLSMESLDLLMTELVKKPFRCKPVYLEGVWGGRYMMQYRSLPNTMKNCAWVFDMIPSEVSLLIENDKHMIEIPYYTFVHSKGVELMGQPCVDKFKGFFPVRFNYDDTWHSNGNMSIQCHPYHDYIMEENHELGRQDESYYVVEAAEGAKTYLGFKEGINPDEFMQEVYKSESEKTPFDYTKYVNAVDSVPGTQVMIPAGTVHSSGRNQLVLEIGSLTIGSYTYKLYDYMRKDLDGNPRPIHSRHGDAVLQKYRDTKWVNENIVKRARPLKYGEEVSFQTLGEHDLLYFSLNTVQFVEKYEDNTNGKFHVLTVTNGEKVKIVAKHNEKLCYEAAYLDVIVVPANIGEYEVINLSDAPATIHKTLLKDGFENEMDAYEKAFTLGGK